MFRRLTSRRHPERSEGAPHLAWGPSFLLLALLAGCKSPTQAAPTAAPVASAPAQTYPARPTAPPPPFKLFHQTDNSLTLVTAETTTDEQIESLIWQLHDAARDKSFDKLHLPQTFIDKRDPIVFIHIYRGTKCAAEKYAAGNPPCGGSYHAAGDYTLGSFKDPNRDDGVLLHDENHQTELLEPRQRGETVSSPSTLTPTAKTIPPHSVPTAAARGHRLQIRLRPPSGLGNQLFQYAASLYFAQRYHADLKILHEPETRNLSQEHPRFFLLDRFRIKTPMRFVHLLDRVLCTPQVTRLSVTTLTRTHVHRAQSFANNWTFVPELLFPKATRRLYIDDYFLCYQYAAAVEEALRHELQFRDAPSGQNALVLEHIASELHPVSLHVRRGDYKGFGDDAMLPMQYYRDAMSALRASLPEATFFIFSDDIDFCRANLPDGGRYIFVDHNDQAHAHEDLRLMAACHHHIIANSTFSWWGAWLNPRRDKQVIAPDRWLDPRYPHPDICPPNWTIISSTPKAT